MKFNVDAPQLTDPYLEGRHLMWLNSREPLSYYFWAQQVSPEVEFHGELAVEEISLDSAKFYIYRGLSKQELLYRLKFRRQPVRFTARPVKDPHVLFWTYGTEGGASKEVAYLYRDKNISLHHWVDKRSFLAAIRNSYDQASLGDGTFW